MVQKKKNAQMGDLVEFDVNNPDVLTFKLREQPLDVMQFLEDKNNPRIVYNDPADSEVPVDPPRWIVVQHRDLFTPKGHRVRLVKISNLTTSTVGWVPGSSLKIIASSEEEFG